MTEAMMEFVDTDDLKGKQLDYWVAFAERQNGYAPSEVVAIVPPAFSSDATLSDPIIEREGIHTVLACDAEFGNQFVAGFKPEGSRGFPHSEYGVCMGDGPLEAALRFYVHYTFSKSTAHG
jgi:hypothetical protein